MSFLFIELVEEVVPPKKFLGCGDIDVTKKRFFSRALFLNFRESTTVYEGNLQLIGPIYILMRDSANVKLGTVQNEF